MADFVRALGSSVSSTPRDPICIFLKSGITRQKPAEFCIYYSYRRHLIQRVIENHELLHSLSVAILAIRNLRD